ncbi:LuxR C-terminal-related transcriptional regulator [Yersinia sp. 22-579]|uniref:LuxR C-terminal-related transcriptional regulator n=1 Tax=Yersinia sp. 22-579 TaxID=3057580 RepID=UPI00263B0A1E|nr:LuxR C-terminal-related transcriptional regulator [Yersinia sp. 22-579]
MLGIKILSKNNVLKRGIVEIIRSLLKKYRHIKNTPSKSGGELNEISTPVDLLFIDADYIDDINKNKGATLTSDNINVFLLGKKKTNSYFLTKKKSVDGSVSFVNIDRNILNLIGEISKAFNPISGKVVLNLNEKLTTNCKKDILSKSERDIITKYISGLSGKMIAKILNKSEKTVSNQKRNAMEKLGITTNQELINVFLNKQGQNEI